MRPKGTFRILILIGILTFGIVGITGAYGLPCWQICQNQGYSNAYCSFSNCGSDVRAYNYDDCWWPYQACCCSASSKITSCNYPLSNCNNNCVNLGNDPNNCGSCGHSCGSGNSCSNGVCSTPQPPSGGGNVCCCDTGSNCQSNCYMTTSCTHGLGESLCPNSACQNQPSGCSSPNTQCSTGCVNLQNDPNNCGSCGHSCGAGVACNNGACGSSGSCSSTDTKNYVCQGNQIYSCGTLLYTCTHCCTGTANCPSTYGACCLATTCAGTSPGGTSGFSITATVTDQTNNNQGTSITVSPGDVIVVSGTVSQNGSPITTLCQNCVNLINPDNNFQIGSVGIISGGIYRATMTIPQQNSQSVFHMVAQYTPASVNSNQLTFTISNANIGTANNVRLDKITVNWLDSSGNPRQTWDVYNNGPTGQTPSIPTWSSGSDFSAGNMRINYDFTNTGSSALSLSVATQTHGQVSGQNGDTITTSGQSISAGSQAHQAHWIRMWAEGISETNRILISGSATGPSFTFVVNNGGVSSGGDPCNEDGACAPDDSCMDQTNINGFCVSLNYYNLHKNYFKALTGSYSCGPNFCLVADTNNDGCYNTRGFCYAYDSTSPTGCRGPNTQSNAATQECTSRGGNACSQTLAQGAASIDPSTAYQAQGNYQPVVCQNTQGTTGTSSSTPGTSSSTPATSSSTSPPTSSSTSPPTTSSSTTTVTTILPFPLVCSLCSANSACTCSVPSNSCNNGFWSVQNLFGTPLPQLNITTIPPYIVFYFPNQTGTVNATANCFDAFPNNRSNSTLVTVLNPFLACPQTCDINSQCTCTVNNCNSGLFFAVFNNSVFSFQPFATNPYQASFTQSQTGNVTVISTCDSPQMPSARASIQINSGTITSSTTTTTTNSSIPPVSGTFSHSNFVCSQAGSKWTCTLNYDNEVGQQVFLYFDAYAAGKIAQTSSSISLTTGPGQTFTSFDCSSALLSGGSYVVSFKVYQTQTRNNNPIDWSTSKEVQYIRC